MQRINNIPCHITNRPQKISYTKDGIEYYFVEVTCNDGIQYGVQAFGDEANRCNLCGQPSLKEQEKLGPVEERIDGIHYRCTVSHIKNAILVAHLSNDGSLGERATEFDFHVVYGVNPRDPRYIIAPDIYNQLVMVSIDGGRSWATDTNLTNEVTKNGSLLLYGGDQYHTQVTHILFDPYHLSRILIGTRDSGVIISEGGGYNWTTIPNSEIPIRYE